MRKALYLFLLINLCLVEAFGQKLQDINQLDNLILALKNNNETNFELKTNFSHIRVVDARYDINKIGFANYNGKYRRVNFEKGINTLESYLNQCYINQPQGNGPELVLFVKTLWLQDLKAGEKLRNTYDDDQQLISSCQLQVDAFALFDNTYRALTRIDTTSELPNGVRYTYPELVKSSFYKVIRSVKPFDDTQLILNRKVLQPEEVNTFYKARSQKLKNVNDVVNEKGIYLTYDDFLNNRLTKYNFTVEQEERADYLYIEEGGEKKLFTDFWGFNNGVSHFIKVGRNFFELKRDLNTYSFWGCFQALHNAKPRSENRIARYALFGVFGELHHTELNNYLRPMQLNADNGLPY